jgi:hypothetical protein
VTCKREPSRTQAEPCSFGQFDLTLALIQRCAVEKM